jgi:hypothetical protein
MSTRSHIIFKDSEDEQLTYRHCDGYPLGSGSPVIPDLRGLADEMSRIAGTAASQWVIHGRNTRLSRISHKVCAYDTFHFDIEHIYIVDVEDKTVEHYEPFEGYNFDVEDSDELRQKIEPTQTFDLE